MRRGLLPVFVPGMISGSCCVLLLVFLADLPLPSGVLGEVAPSSKHGNFVRRSANGPHGSAEGLCRAAASAWREGGCHLASAAGRAHGSADGLCRAVESAWREGGGHLADAAGRVSSSLDDRYRKEQPTAVGGHLKGLRLRGGARGWFFDALRSSECPCSCCVVGT